MSRRCGPRSKTLRPRRRRTPRPRASRPSSRGIVWEVASRRSSAPTWICKSSAGRQWASAIPWIASASRGSRCSRQASWSSPTSTSSLRSTCSWASPRGSLAPSGARIPWLATASSPRTVSSTACAVTSEAGTWALFAMPCTRGTIGAHPMCTSPMTVPPRIRVRRITSPSDQLKDQGSGWLEFAEVRARLQRGSSDASEFLAKGIPCCTSGCGAWV
mmetsp:Transcript_29861/g.69193  ORF Transcript_29861/g.69193 Transcript_29861/m.69193 type:complete len:217 (-) Transcript_29861:194-844(-)